MDYIINKDTYYIMYDGFNTIIKELDTEFVLKENKLKSILENSCEYYGSSLEGRIKGTKNLINNKYKLPIIISEINNIIFFSLHGKKNNEIIWFNFNMIKSYKKDGDLVRINFINGEEKKFMLSYTVFNNQIMKCSRLIIVLLSRK